MADERLISLRDILLELHNAPLLSQARSVLRDLYRCVSAIEIPHGARRADELDSGVTFEDVMEPVMSMLIFLKMPLALK